MAGINLGIKGKPELVCLTDQTRRVLEASSQKYQLQYVNKARESTPCYTFIQWVWSFTCLSIDTEYKTLQDNVSRDRHPAGM